MAVKVSGTEVIDDSRNVVNVGTVDGRDVSVDGTKLDGIEVGATADQTGAEIKSLYEAEANTNAFTDAEKSKLGGIEAAADVTDTTNVSAAGALMRTGGTMTGNLILNADPTAPLQAATKEYVDTIAAAGLHYHEPVRVESPVNINATYNNGTAGVGATLTNAGTQEAITVDGVTLSLNDRVLLYVQTNAAHNGVYTVTTVGNGSTNWVLTRATDADSYAASDPDSLGQGDAFFVKEGNTGAGELYVMNTEGAITIGTTGITFTQVASTAVFTAGTGLTLTGTQFSIDGTVLVDSDIGSSVQGYSSVLANTTASFTTADETKLDGIEAGATADQTASEILTAIKTVDGAASGLDADLLDGQHGTYYQPASTALTTSTTFGGDVSGTYNAIVVADDSHNHIIANVDGLQTALDGKAAASHTHTASNITDFTEAVQDLIGADVVAGTGIAVSYNDATGDTTITNTAPDQTVSLTGSGATSVSGTYPNFTISSTDNNTTYSAGGGLSLSGTTFSHTDTSSQASVNNSYGNVIQDITLDTYGHLTGINSVNLSELYYLRWDIDYLFPKLSNGLLITNNSEIQLNSLKTTLINTTYLTGSNSFNNGGIRLETAQATTHDGNTTAFEVDDRRAIPSSNGDYSHLEVTRTGESTPLFEVYTNRSINAFWGFTEDTVVAELDGNIIFHQDYHPNADTLTTARSINGTSFNGSANITTANWGTARTLTIGSTGKSVNGSGNVAWSLAEIGALAVGAKAADSDLLDGYDRLQIVPYHSISDFANGTLVTTDINAAISSSDSFVIEITGKAYGSSVPHSVIAEGYIYADTIINTNGVNISGSNFTYLKVMNNNGYLSVWWPRHGYWNSYSVIVRSSSADTASHNRVTSIVDSVDPAGATKKIQIDLAKTWNSGNDGTGSGLDADLLDGQQGSYYYPASNPNGYTTYSAGNGLGLSGTTFSVDSDLRGDVFYIGRDTNDYIGVETTQINFVLDGNTDMRLENDGDLHVDGNIIAYSTTISDERLKTDIVKIDNALDKVCELGGYTFTYTADDKKSAGVIAQEVKKVLPSAIVESKLPLKMGDDDETEYMTVQYDQLVGLLIEAVKELRAEVTELKGK
jgi:hypothetical protein